MPCGRGHKPKPDQPGEPLNKELVSVAEAISRLTGKSADQIFVELEPHGDGYVMPVELIGLISNASGTMDYSEDINAWVVSQQTQTGNTIITWTVTDTLVRVHQVMVEGKVDGTVTDRTLKIRLFPDEAIADQFPLITHTGLVLSASQRGRVLLPPYTGMSVIDDFGTTSVTATESPLPIMMPVDSYISTLLNNYQAADIHSLQVIYEVLQK